MPDPIYQTQQTQTNMRQAVDKMLGKERNAPDVVYEFGDGKRKFVEYPSINPYTGETV